MKVFVIVGENEMMQNISARAVYDSLEKAKAHLNDKDKMYYDDRAVIIELELQ